MEALANFFGSFFLAFTVIAFIAIVLLLEGLYLTWSAHKSPEAKKLGRRLQALAAGGRLEGEALVMRERMLSEVPALQRLLLGIPRLQHLDQMIEQAGMQLSVGRLLLTSSLLGGTVFLLVTLSRIPPLAALVLVPLAFSLPFLYVRRRRTARLRAIDRQLPDALDLISRALRAGHAFPSGLQMVGEEMPEPIAGAFRMTHEEVNYGISLPQALNNMAARIPSTDLRYFVIAVLIQRETGGNLTEVLRNLSTLIRERFKLLEKVQVLAAEGKLSAWIVGALPFVVGSIINVINPEFMQVLWTDPMGSQMIGGMLVLMMLGALWMRQIIRIHV